MAIDFTFPPEIDELRLKVRRFIQEEVRPREAEIRVRENDRRFLIEQVIAMREAAQRWGLWLPHMPKEFGGMGRWARFADGADEVHQWRIAQRAIDAYKTHGADGDRRPAPVGAWPKTGEWKSSRAVLGPTLTQVLDHARPGSRQAAPAAPSIMPYLRNGPKKPCSWSP